MTEAPQMNDHHRELFRNLGLTGDRDMSGLDASPYDTLIALGVAKIAKDGHIRLTPNGKTQWKAAFPQSAAAKQTIAADVQKADRKSRKAPPMKESAADQEVAAKAYEVSAEEIRQFVERIEKSDEEKKKTTDRQKEIYSEAKGRGYNTKALRRLVALRKRNPDEVMEEDAMLHLYQAAMGTV